MLYATVRQRKIHVKNPVTVIQNGVNVDELILEMDDEWGELDSIVAVFTLKYTEKEGDTNAIVSKEISKEMLHTFGQPVMVPWECLAQTGRLMVSCTGYMGSEKVMTTMYPDSFWNVVQNGPKTGDEPMEPTPTLYEQVLAAAGSANAAAQAATEARAELLQDKENGAFDGKDGETPQFEIGTVTTGASGSEAKVNMTGTQLKPILNFVLPRGAAGKDGAPGRDGNPGRDGTDGKDGSPGQPGRDGVDGRDGSDGQDGKDGANGVDGKDGRGILEIVDNDNGTWTVRFDDGTTQTVKPPAPIDGGEVVPGEDGGYYIPKVENGVLSWTPSKADMPSVESAEIKGADGKDGSPGEPGKDGTSVTVASVSESTEDGGTNVVTFSDGNKLNVKNGKAGKDGSPGADGAPGSTGPAGRGVRKMEYNATANNWTVTYTDDTTETVDGPALFSGKYSDLSGVPNSFKPSAHNHDASDINAGTLSIDRLPLDELATSLGGTQFATGSLNGTGQTSLSITFPFVPKFLFMHSEYNNAAVRGNCVYIGGVIAGGVFYGGNNGVYATVTVSGTTLTFKEKDNFKTYINATDVVIRWAAFR